MSCYGHTNRRVFFTKDIQQYTLCLQGLSPSVFVAFISIGTVAPGTGALGIRVTPGIVNYAQKQEERELRDAKTKKSAN